jgi:N-carbamoyl-L-amino-acid hydrolase
VLHPNLVNVVAARATLTVDLRNTDDAVLAEAERRLFAHCAELEQREGVTIERRSLARFEPVDFDPAMVDLVEKTARAQGLSTMRLPSGAGHDAQALAAVVPSGMIFVPSTGGVSHDAREHTPWEDCVNGANTLLHAAVDYAGRGS